VGIRVVPAAYGYGYSSLSNLINCKPAIISKWANVVLSEYLVLVCMIVAVSV
jgi:hypothetical protein